MDNKDFNGKSVLLTGGSRGIGLATAAAFLEGGARVAVCGRDAARLQAAERQLRTLGEVLAAPADVRDRAQVEQLARKAHAHFGRIDVLVNNAGVTWVGRFADEDYDSMDAVIDVNLKGVLYTTRAVLPLMLAQGGGVIINVASGAGLSGFPDIAVYCASKFGVVGFTESLHREVRDRGVRVYALCPGRVATDMQVQYSGRRIGMPPEEVARRIVRLAGPDPRADPGSCVEV